MKLSWRVELVQLAIIAGMFAVSAWAWPQVPDRLPVHWNLQGEIDRYGGKFEGLMLLPLVTLGLYFLLLLVPLVDPGRLNYQNFRKAYGVIRVVLVLFMALVYALMILSAFGYQGNTSTVLFLAMGVMFLVLGNFMGKLRPNWFVGVRTPWTLSSKLSWDKTHRLAGWLFVLMGALFMLLALVQTTWMFITVFTINGMCILWMVVYSYLVYRSDPDRTSPAATSPGNDSSSSR